MRDGGFREAGRLAGVGCKFGRRRVLLHGWGVGDFLLHLLQNGSVVYIWAVLTCGRFHKRWVQRSLVEDD